MNVEGKSQWVRYESKTSGTPPVASTARAGFDPVAFLEAQGGFQAESCGADCWRILAAASALAPEQAQQVAEALTVWVPESLREPLRYAVLDQAQLTLASIRQTSRFIAGLLDGMAGANEAARSAEVDRLLDLMVKRLETDYEQVLASDARNDCADQPAERLLDQLKALALAQAGASMSVQRLLPLLNFIGKVEDCAGEGSDQALRSEHLALLLRTLCEVLVAEGGMQPAHLQAVLSHVLDPGQPYTGEQRGCMVYHLAAELKAWKPGDPSRLSLLRAITAAPLLADDAIGAMAWGLGLHLTGEDPEAHDWHDEHVDLLAATRADAPIVIKAAVELGQALPPAQLERLGAGLRAACEEFEHARPLRAARARLALRSAIDQLRLQGRLAQHEALRRGLERGDLATRTPRLLRLALRRQLAADEAQPLPQAALRLLDALGGVAVPSWRLACLLQAVREQARTGQEEWAALFALAPLFIDAGPVRRAEGKATARAQARAELQRCVETLLQHALESDRLSDSNLRVLLRAHVEPLRRGGTGPDLDDLAAGLAPKGLARLVRASLQIALTQDRRADSAGPSLEALMRVGGAVERMLLSEDWHPSGEQVRAIAYAAATFLVEEGLESLLARAAERVREQAPPDRRLAIEEGLARAVSPPEGLSEPASKRG